ncbi:CPBP family intramembrane glutamic endopeptidase [Lutispora saccharofermentans]|uniref:CPBP family intramembrane metalloprotease n=1 Tax=Lutispora saccharofermentans TaxID=3024236 RepID=A0ABT1NBY5_9FIRM|nr:CPBP family intramembrane glutamic endopeptidase [Lutispora saccharofermentans]MCQ1528775.1 CPBP family intramembrane metalloprotease [Lutispora saccharofermentans]
MDAIRYIVFIFVFLIVNTPIYLQLYRVFLINKKPITIISLTVLYWFGAIFTENFIPFIVVILLLYRYHLHKVNCSEGAREDALGHKVDNGESYMRDIDVWRFDRHSVLNVTIATLVAKVLVTIINAIYINMLSLIVKTEIQPQEVVTDFYESGFWPRFVLFFVIVIFAPFVEEYVFRYFLYDKLFLPRMPRGFAAVLSAVIFTTAHYNLSGIPSFFGLALFCTYMYEKRGYFAAVTAHMAFNLSTVILLVFIKM